MTGDRVAVVALVMAGGLALVDWWAVHRRRPAIESLAKPAAMVALVVAAATGTAEPVRPWLVAALLLGLVGDVLLLPAVDRFVAGLAAFLAGHLALVGAAMAAGLSGTGAPALGLVGAAVAVVAVGRPIVAAVAGSRLRWPVVAYVTVIAAMLAAVVGTGRWVAAAGAVLFALSDSLLGWTRFVTPRHDRRWLVHATYHLGQGLLVVGLA